MRAHVAQEWCSCQKQDTQIQLSWYASITNINLSSSLFFYKKKIKPFKLI